MSFFLQIGLPSLGKLALSKWNAVGIRKNSGRHDPHKLRGGADFAERSHAAWRARVFHRPWLVI